jgi:hypothetical protein
MWHTARDHDCNAEVLRYLTVGSPDSRRQERRSNHKDELTHAAGSGGCVMVQLGEAGPLRPVHTCMVTARHQAIDGIGMYSRGMVTGGAMCSCAREAMKGIAPICTLPAAVQPRARDADAAAQAGFIPMQQAALGMLRLLLLCVVACRAQAVAAVLGRPAASGCRITNPRGMHGLWRVGTAALQHCSTFQCA